MKRLPLLLTALIALAWPAAADARSVVAEKAKNSRDDVLRYWTAEKMRSAKPAERARGGGAGGKVTYPFTSSQAPTPYTAFPTSTHGKVFFTDSGANYVCSGTALISGNESVVWTAGHCVHDGPGSFHTNWMFVPAYRDGLRPYGTFTARTLYTTSGWQSSGNLGYDLGAARVDTPNGTTLTDTVGGRGMRSNQARQQQYNAYGYPAAGKFNGQRLWICDAPWARDDNSVAPATMAIGCDQTGGSSGGGWVVGNDVYSVNSYGYGGLKNVMFGPYQGPVAQELYTTASAG